MQRDGRVLQWSQRQWRCQAYLRTTGWAKDDLFLHICTLPHHSDNFHLCWCGCNFSTSGVIAMQPRLPLGDGPMGA